MAPIGLKMGSFHLFVHGPISILKQRIFDPFLTNSPKTAHFQGILGVLEGQNGPPWAQNGLKPLVLASRVV